MMAWIKFRVEQTAYRGKSHKYMYAIPQDAIKCIIVNYENRIVFDLGNEDSMYSTDVYATHEQACATLNEILNMWGKNIELTKPRGVNVDG